VDRNGTQLECKPQYVTSADGHDPIVSIRLTLSDGNAQVIHIAQSGQTFNRADQYSVNSAVWSNNQFTWSGRNNKKSTVTMVGKAKPMTDDDKWFSYTESVFEGGSVNKTYEMFSVCAITSQPPKKQAGLVVVVPKAGQVSPAEADADARHPFGFRRLIIETTGEAPEACFRFSRALDPLGEARYGDYVRIQPEASIALRIANTDLCVNGLASGTDYKVTLAKGLLSKSGDRTENAETVDVNLGDKPSRVSISGDGYILPRNTSNGLAIQTVNVHNLKIRVLRMSDRLVLSNKDVLQNNTENSASRYYYTQRYTIENGGLQRYQLRELVKQAASLIWSGTMEIVRDHNRTIQTAFPLAGIIKSEQPGAYLVIAEDAANAMPDKELSTVAASDEQNVFWRDLYETIPAHWVMVTDIALTAMTGANGLHVSARSLKSAEPLAGVKVTLLATGQDQLGQATTDANGSTTFGPGLLRGHGASAAATITAYGAQGDFAMGCIRSVGSGRVRPPEPWSFRSIRLCGSRCLPTRGDGRGRGLASRSARRRSNQYAADARAKETRWGRGKTLLARSSTGGRISSVDTLKQDCCIRAVERRGVGRPRGRADWPCPIQCPGLRAPDAQGNAQALGDSSGA
jgi:hypothetical protein